MPLSLGSSGAEVRRFTVPGALDLVFAKFERHEHARDFQPPVWFDPEVTNEPGYQDRSIAPAELPETLDVDPTDAALNSLLDTLENRFGARHRRQQQAWCKERAAS
jgi:hypothetical protein